MVGQIRFMASVSVIKVSQTPPKVGAFLNNDTVIPVGSGKYVHGVSMVNTFHLLN
ncbi:hypothetical protein FACS1894158_15250 [Betaproteobacteria bacterium]|nr:hypothetical protein FACS1894158_15250 [Betaproteobacteria bacterium]